MMEVGELISFYRRQCGMTIDELAEKSGVAKGTLNKIMGGVTKAPTLDNMKAIARALGKRLADFDDEPELADLFSSSEQNHIKKYRALDRHGKEMVDIVMDKETERIEADRLARAAELLKESRSEMEAAAEPTVEIMYFSVPYQLHPMSAGTGTESDEEYTENLRLIKEPPYGTSYVARVSGDSMEPTYNNGDLVFVHSTVEIREGQVGVFLMDGQQWIKELGDGVLISHNDEYEPRRMTPDVRCQGRVLGVCDDSYFEK